ncbi:hypothetical protein [Telmatospirillum sp.]|uniref:hypothetical protein n=1 Tax=Telmatospirillum sp. TaxID=2079197 RepID=UPI00284D4226|nr:hypothetical protein [Telmatospirillum sp.]MDR3437160.1 hypothetical protein [Telmatospirillum sp.]
MADRKPVTLDDLSREELLRFVGRQIFVWTEKDLVWAQCEVASAAALRAREEACALSDQLIAAAGAIDCAVAQGAEGGSERDFKAMTRALKKWNEARANYQRLQGEQDKLDAKSDRWHRRADRLYCLYQELPR